MSGAFGARSDAQGLEWRDPRAVTAQWSDAGASDAALLRVAARGGWWDALAAAAVTLIVSREYEHLVLAVSAHEPRVTYTRLPHPSGVAFDAAGERVFVASTRNPNQIVAFGSVSPATDRLDAARGAHALSRRLVPLRSWYLPGSYYVHDLAMIGGRLHANAVGRNAVVELGDDGPRTVWWPASMERDGLPLTGRNEIQLNSIAAGDDLASSYFTASGERPGRYRPGHPKYPVDGRGVVYSGATREPIARGLTRPHSARLHGGRVWVDDSGYGDIGFVSDGRFERVARLPGWTRGLAFAGDVAFVGTSRVIPRFKQYAPGLDVARSRCAIHALDIATGAVIGSLEFPAGNQIFAIEPVPAGWTHGFPFGAAEHKSTNAARALFYAYEAERT